MAIARLGSSVNGGGANQNTSVTISMNITSGSSPFLSVGVFIQAGDYVTGVTYNGVSLTQGVKKVSVAPSLDVIYNYYLVNPPTGSAYDLVVSFSGANRTVGVIAQAYSGVNTYDASGSNSTTNVSSGAATVTTVADNSWATFVTRNTTYEDMVAGANTTLVHVWDFSPSMVLFDNQTNGAITPAGAYTMNASWGGTATNWIATIMSFSPDTRDPASVQIYG